MSYYFKLRSILIFFTIILTSNIITCMKTVDYQVHCFLQQKFKNKHERKIYNQLIHQATWEIKQQCKKIYKNFIEQSSHYPHRRDTVFFIHFDHKTNGWTIHKPSFIPYNKFVKLIKKIYAQYGLQVTCSHDDVVKIAKTELDFEHDYLTLEQFEQYKKMSEEEFTSKISELEKQSSFDNSIEARNFRRAQMMQKFLFWHLQIPTTGLLLGGKFGIDEKYRPLAWHLSLWDLAPKKGQGANVAIIDTGASAFNLQEKEFSETYKKNINITVPDTLQNYGYNLVSENGLDPIQQISISFAHYCDHTKFDSDEFMQNLPEWIIDFIKNKNELQFEHFFTKNAKKEYLTSNKGDLNENGKERLKDLLYGKYGIAPSGENPFFHIVHVQAPYDQEVLLETLPTPKTIGNGNPLSAGHGTFTQGVVNAKTHDNLGISGLAPQAKVTMIKAFNDNGTTNKTTLNAALQRALTLDNSIVSMSLKITDKIDKVADAPLKELIDSIDYVVAASGNDGGDSKIGKKEAYPAKFGSVAFDVGSFQYDDGDYNVSPFTQMEPKIGPKFVAPGSNIFSAGLTPDQTSDSMYLFMSGTSIAVPVITGFIALVLGEFQDVFTREEILKVIYKFSMKFNNDSVWQKYIKLGTPDMRSSLLCLHTLKSLQEELEAKPELNYSFKNHFNNLVQAIYTINYYVPSCYSEEIATSFTNNFANFNKVVKLKQPDIKGLSFLTPTSQNLSTQIDFICKFILNAIPGNHKKSPLSKTTKNLHEKLLKSLQSTLATKKLNLFAKLSLSSQNRINMALKSNKSCMI